MGSQIFDYKSTLIRHYLSKLRPTMIVCWTTTPRWRYDGVVVVVVVNVEVHVRTGEKEKVREVSD
jgi:hypothetical protein